MEKNNSRYRQVSIENRSRFGIEIKRHFRRYLHIGADAVLQALIGGR